MTPFGVPFAPGADEKGVVSLSHLVARWLTITACAAAGLILVAGWIAPAAGMVVAAMNPSAISTAVVHVPPALTLLRDSLLLSIVAAVLAIVLAIAPAGVLATVSGRHAGLVLGLILSPLLIPPQVYAYAWGLLGSMYGPLSAILPLHRVGIWQNLPARAGLISAGWLWPVPALILAAGWRTAGRPVYLLASLDTTPLRAFLRAVLPSLRPWLVASVALVFVITLLEYPIPHLTVVRVYATELLLLSDAFAPPGQIVRMALHIALIVAVVGLISYGSVRALRGWQAVEEDESGRSLPMGGVGYVLPMLALLAWTFSVGIPALAMWLNLRVSGAWLAGFRLFSDEWWLSLGIAIATGVIAGVMATGTSLLAAASPRSGRSLLSGVARAGAFVAAGGAMLPPVALGVGYILVYNRDNVLGDVYTDTPVLWCLALAARYSAIVVLITWLTVGRRAIAAAEQAQTDGAGRWDVLSSVILPTAWPSLLAGMLVVAGLTMFEIVLTQLLASARYSSIALTLLAQMHYGRDDTVITTSLLVMAGGVALTSGVGLLLKWRTA